MSNLIGSLEIAIAVSNKINLNVFLPILSPVTILTVIPDSLHYLIASGIPFLNGSFIPDIAIIVRDFKNYSEELDA